MGLPRFHRTSLAAGLALGLALGALLARGDAPRLLAKGGDRWGDSIVATGPVSLRFLEGLKIQVAQDALYFLDYKTGRLLASVPAPQQVGAKSSVLGTFAERDLVADFKIPPGSQPHFLMTTGALGSMDEGNSPLYVFESTSSQVAVYRVNFQTVGVNQRPKFDLVELKSFARGLPGVAN